MGKIRCNTSLCQESDMLGDMNVLRNNLPTSAEELIVYGCIDKKKKFLQIVLQNYQSQKIIIRRLYLGLIITGLEKMIKEAEEKSDRK